MLNKKEKKRFFDKVEKIPDGCWEWTGALSSGGKGGGKYGSVNLRRLSKYGILKAHRVSWMIHYGPIPDGLYVLHKCDNTKCVKPDHLFVGTHQDNMDDMVNKGRQKTTSQRGTSNASAKLSEHDVRTIIDMLPCNNNRQIAAELNNIVSPGSISLIRRGKSWTHISGIVPREKYESIRIRK